MLQYKYDKNRISIHHTTEKIEMNVEEKAIAEMTEKYDDSYVNENLELYKTDAIKDGYKFIYEKDTQLGILERELSNKTPTSTIIGVSYWYGKKFQGRNPNSSL